MKIRGTAFLAFCLAFGAITCDGGKKEEEAKKAAEEAANKQKEEAKQVAERAAKVAAQKALASQKMDLKSKIKAELDAADRKVAYLKEKSAKLGPAVKKKADVAFEAYETSKTALVALASSIEGLMDMPSVSRMLPQVAPAMESLRNAVAEVEAIVVPSKK